MKIAFIGNITYDKTVIGDKFIKEEGKSSFSKSTSTVGGPAANAAYVANKFSKGTDNVIDFYGQIGNDIEGDFIARESLKENFDMKHINRKKDFLTPFSYIIVNTSNGSRTICSLRDSNDYDNAKIEKFKCDTDYDFILTDGKYVDDTIELMKKNPQAITIIDAGRVNDGVLKICNNVDYIVCSEEFAKELTGVEMGNPKKDVSAYLILKNIFKKAKGITITIGGRGYICEQNGNIVINPAFNTGKNAIDTNGAGDIFHGAFTYALASGNNYNESLRFANITAALSTTKVGGRNSCPELDEVNKYFDNGKDIEGPSKVLKK